MFGIGRKKTAIDHVTNAMIYKLEDVNRRFPGVIPGKGVQSVGNLSLSIAMKVILYWFNEDNFDKILIRECSIEKDFPSGWSRADALSRWYALGFICLTHCSMKAIWSDALTVSAGMQVYDAAVEKIWILSSMTDEVKERVETFMRTNIKSITSSLRTVVDGRTRAVWFRRYAARVKGENPVWEIRQGGLSSVAEDVLSGGRVSTDSVLNSQLSARFEALAEDIMKLVTGAEQIP